MPLWFHVNTCFFKNEILEINVTLKSNYYDFIILQPSGERPNEENFENLKQSISQNKHYKLIHTVDDISNNKIYTFKKVEK